MKNIPRKILTFDCNYDAIEECNASYVCSSGKKLVYCNNLFSGGNSKEYALNKLNGYHGRIISGLRHEIKLMLHDENFLKSLDIQDPFFFNYRHSIQASRDYINREMEKRRVYDSESSGDALAITLAHYPIEKMGRFTELIHSGVFSKEDLKIKEEDLELIQDFGIRNQLDMQKLIGRVKKFNRF